MTLSHHDPFILDDPDALTFPDLCKKLEAISENQFKERNFTRTEGPSYVLYTSNNIPYATHLLFLVPGARSTCGLWSRQITARHGFKGTMFSYIERAFNLKMACAVVQLKSEDVTSLESAVDMLMTMTSQGPIEIDVIAHSRGGHYMMHLLEYALNEAFTSSLRSIHLLDSVHDFEPDNWRKWLSHHAVNWAASRAPGGTVLDATLDCFYPDKASMVWLSAGHETHEWTPWSAIDMIFEEIVHYFTCSGGCPPTPFLYEGRRAYSEADADSIVTSVHRPVF